MPADSGLTLILAPFGAFALNLAAITAAIAMSPEAHPDPKRRYIAGVSAGIFYILAGLFGAVIGALFAAFPAPLIAALAGLALLGTIGNGLSLAVADESAREAALIAFLITASGLTLFGIGSAFWGLVGGLVAWWRWRCCVNATPSPRLLMLRQSLTSTHPQRRLRLNPSDQRRQTVFARNRQIFA